jgi:hypothetical protein
MFLFSLMEIASSKKDDCYPGIWAEANKLYHGEVEHADNSGGALISGLAEPTAMTKHSSC